MGHLLNTLLRTTILDEGAYREWRERPNLFLRGIVLIVLVSLVAGLVSFGVSLVNNVSAVNPVEIRQEIEEAMEQQFQWNPAWQENPEMRQMMDETMDVIVPMVTEIASIEAPLPRGVSGFFQALGSWLSGAFRSLGGWLLYGALVLVVVNLLGGGAKLPDFLGMVSLYAVPGLLGLLAQIPCVGCFFGLAGMIWSIVVYVKAVEVVTDLDLGQSILAVLAPAVVLLLLALVVAFAFGLWIALLTAF